MTLGELIAVLNTVEPERKVALGFHKPHSYRGFYDELAFEPHRDTTVGAMLKDAESALGKTFTGWKGGDFTMEKHTTVWMSQKGDCGEQLGPALVAYMLGEKPRAICFKCEGTGFLDYGSESWRNS